MKKIGVVQYGCGPVGCNVARLAMQRQNLRLVGAVDAAQEKVGKDLGELLGADKMIGVAVAGKIEAVENVEAADVVFHCTSSSLSAVMDQIQEIAQTGCDIISTCEELSFPFLKNAQMSDAVDRIARDHGITVLATGINPGFLMDVWPLFMSGVCQRVDTVRITRVQDASQRRIPFQKKIGAGLTVKEFKDFAESGLVRHVGIEESVGMIASGMGWKLEEVTETIDPVVSERRVTGNFGTIEPGHVAGIRQIGLGFVESKARIILEFLAYIGAEDSYDEVRFFGVPDLCVRISDGVNGDVGTAAMVVNSVSRVVDARPGLLTARDLPMAVCST